MWLMDMMLDPIEVMQTSILSAWFVAAIGSVLVWNGFGFQNKKAVRLGIYSALAILCICIFAIRIYAIQSGAGHAQFTLQQLLPLTMRVAAKAVFWLIVLVQSLKLIRHLWGLQPYLFLSSSAVLTLYAMALTFQWPEAVKWMLFFANAAILFGVFVIWWKGVGLKAGNKLEAKYRRVRSSLMGFLLPELVARFLYRFRITPHLVRLSLVAAGIWLSWLVGDWTGEKTFPHLFGLGYGRHWLEQDAQVLLPFLTIAGSVFVFAACGYAFVHSLRIKGHSALRFCALAGCGMVALSWWSYRGFAREKLAELDSARDLVAAMDTLPSLERHFLLTRYRRLVEYRLGTREWNAMVFHRLADEPFGLPYRFPGFLIGVEQANRYLIAVPDGDNATGKAKAHGKIHQLLNNRRRTFVSHITEFSKRGSDTVDAEIVETGMLYNLYESPDYDTAFARSFHEMDKLKDILLKRLGDANGPPREFGGTARAAGLPDSTRMDSNKSASLSNGQGYTHFMVYCMGWNTDQQESIRNYNSLMGFLHAAAREDSTSRSWKDANGVSRSKPFRPLVIGLSWPSEWGFLKPLSYLAKAGDADETGLVWGSYLLKNVLKPLKEKYDLPLVLVGHSFGARVLSRAVASQPEWIKGVPSPAKAVAMDSNNKDIDLFVGLQGAVSANRFEASGKLTSGWMDAGQYLGMEKMRTRFIFTWSKADAANPMAAYATGANHVGGEFGHCFILQHRNTFWPCVYADTAGIDEREKWKYPEDNRFDPSTGWTASARKDRRRIFSVDLSSIVKDQPYGKGGGAHSDIYTPEIGSFLWKTILAFAPGEFRSPDSTPENAF